MFVFILKRTVKKKSSKRVSKLVTNYIQKKFTMQRYAVQSLSNYFSNNKIKKTIRKTIIA